MFSSRGIGVTQEFMLPVTQRAQALNQLSFRAKWLLPSYSKALLQTLCLFQLLCFMSEIYKCRKVLRVFFGMLLHTKQYLKGSRQQLQESRGIWVVDTWDSCIYHSRASPEQYFIEKFPICYYINTEKMSQYSERRGKYPFTGLHN